MINFIKKTLPGVMIIGGLMVSSPMIAEAHSENNKPIMSQEKTVADNLLLTLSANSIQEKIAEVNSKKTITVSRSGNKEKKESNARTVKDFLDENGIVLGENDTVIPSLESKLKKVDSIAIIHFNEEIRTEEEEVDFKKVEEFSFDVPYGETKVMKKGEKGIVEKTYKKTLKNSIVLSDEKIKEKTKKEVVNEKIAIGTKEVIEEDIDFETKKENSNSLYEGETKVVQKGEKGQKTLIYENKDKNRNLVEEKVNKNPIEEIIHVGTKKRPANAIYPSGSTDSKALSNAKYTLSQFMFNGVIRDNGKKFTYYSQSVLPGGGLSIPGRHVSEAGYVSDKDGFIVVASNRGIPKGSIIETPFGAKGKVYDVCESCSPEWFDIYTR